MRFQQLNRDPNSIMRKKLVKSKKNWIVVSSLSFAGGLLLLGGPTEIVHAADTTVAPTEQVATPTSSDSKTDAIKTDSTKSADVTKVVAPVTTEENTDSTVQSDTVAPVEKETATTEKTDATDNTNAVSETLNKETTTSDVEETGATSEAQPVVAKDTQTTAESENTEVPVSSPDVKDTQTTTEDVKNIDGEKVDTLVPDSDITTDETTDTNQSDINKENVIQTDGAQDDILAANLAVSKAQLASLGINAEALTLTPETEVLADGNIAEGTQGETPWTIDTDGVLHLGTAGKTTTLSKNTITDTSTSGSTTTTPTTSETPTSNTSSWNKYANNVKVIQFDGAIKGSDDISNMFSNFNNLTDITNITNLDLTETSNASGLFMNNPKLTGISQNSTVGTNKVDLTENDLSNLTNVSSMFMNDSSIVNLELPSYDVLHNKSKGFRRVTDSSYMFKNDISLVAPKFGSWTMSSNKSTKGMFQNDTNLGDLILNLWIVWNSDIDTGDSSIGEGMFDGAKLSSITFGSSAVFKSYTALPSTSKGWIETGVMNKGEDDITPTNGGKSFAANLKDATDYSGNTLSSMPGQISGMNVKAMRFSPDGVAPDSYNNISMTVQTNLGEQTFTGLEGPLGNAVSVTMPSKPGYTPNFSTVTGTILNENEATTNIYVTYVGNDVNNKSVAVNGPTKDSSTSFVINNAKIGDTVTITPIVSGYTVTPGSATISADKDGNPVVTVNTQPTYTGNDVNNKSVDVNGPTKDASTSFVINNAKIGDTVAITPTVPGYTVTPGSATITADKDGKPVITNIVQPKYTGNTIASWSTGKNEITTPNNQITVTGTTNSNNEPARIGDTVTIAPEVPGYTISKNGSATIIADENGKPMLSNVTQPIYSANSVSSWSTTENSVKIPTGNTTVSGILNSDGKTTKIGDTVTIAPEVPGYTISKNGSATISADSEGNPVVTVNEQPIYSGNAVKNKLVTVNGPTKDSSTDFIINNAKIGDTVAITPTVPGYQVTPGSATVTADKNGNPIVTVINQPIYIGNDTDPITVNFKTPNGNESYTIPAGKVGDKVTVTVPNDIKGYYPTSSEITGTISDKNTFIPDNIVNISDIKYLGVENKSTTIKLKTPDGKITSLTIPAGRFGDDPVTVTAQKVSGYTAPSILVTFGADGIPTIVDAKTPDKEISTSDTLTYSRIPSSHTIIQKDTEKTDIAAPKQNSQNVATYSEKGQILLYTLGEDNKMTAISNYGLAKQSTWYSDEQITVDGIQYLRVATNKWVKASQVYSYQDLNQYVRTYDKTAKVLYKSEDEVINNRILKPNTSWFSDRTTYVINGDKYYRVATNEFVSAKDAYIYQPTNMVVKTHTDSSSKNLYTAKGELITNRSLVADSNWLVDSIVYIEGIKYYRVATNEFIKASDVDINH